MSEPIRGIMAEAILQTGKLPVPEQISGCSDPECCIPVYDIHLDDEADDIAVAILSALAAKGYEVCPL